MHIIEGVEPGARKVKFYTVFALLAILAGFLLYAKVISAVPVKASSAPTGCNAKNVSNSASTSSAVNLRPGHIRYILVFNCGRWSDAALPSLAITDIPPDVTTKWMDQDAGYILVTGADGAVSAPPLAKFTIELINPEIGYKHDESGTRIVPSHRPIAVKPFNLEYGYKHDVSGTQIVPAPTRITVESINLEYGFKHDASGTRIIPPLASITIEPIKLEYGYRLVANSEGTRTAERDILVKGIPIPFTR